MPEITITLPGTIRIKKNSKRIYRAGKHNVVLPSKAYVSWENEIRPVALEKAVVPPLSCPVEVCATCYVKGQLPDLSGALESVGDALQGIIWADDKQIYSWDGSRIYHEKKDPRTVVRVRW